MTSDRQLSKFKIELNSKFGRHLVASMPISPGQVIIDEVAIVQGPSPTSLIVFNSPSVCPVCFFHFCPQTNPNITCAKCFLSLCQEKNCAENVLHTDIVCRVFEALPQLKQILSKNSSNWKSYVYQFITVLRCLATKSRDPIKWIQILRLQGNSPANVTPMEEAFQLLSWDLIDARTESNTNSEKLSNQETIQKMATHCLGVLQTNSFSNLRRTKSVENLYFFSSFMAHSCEPNTDRQFDPFSSRVIVSASREIKIGEPITNTYVPYLNNTKERHEQLLKPPWSFACHCPRCVHPTEFDSFLSGLKCHICNNLTLCHFILRNVDEDTTNNCQFTKTELVCKCSCGWATPGEGTLAKLMLADEELAMTKEEDSYLWLEKTMKEEWLHANHSLLLNLKFQLCQSLGGTRDIHGLSETHLRKKISYAQDVVSTLNKLSRTWYMDIYMFKGRVYFHLWLAQWELERRRNQKKDEEKLAMNPFQFELKPDDSDMPVLIRVIAERAYGILKFAIPGTDEAKMKQVLDDTYKLYPLDYC